MAKAKKNDFFNQLAKMPPQNKAGLLIGALVVCGGLYWQLSYSSLADERDAARRTNRSYRDESTKLDKDLVEMEQIADETDKLQQTIRDFKKALPTEAELPAFFALLQKKAGDAGVTIRRWDRQQEEAVSEFVKVPVEIEIGGTYYQIKKYFSALGPPAKSPKSKAATTDEKSVSIIEDIDIDERIVSIENLTIGQSTAENDRVILTAKFIASTFRQTEVEGSEEYEATANDGGKLGRARRAHENRVEQATKTEDGGADKTKPGVDRLKNPGAGVP